MANKPPIGCSPRYVRGGRGASPSTACPVQPRSIACSPTGRAWRDRWQLWIGSFKMDDLRTISDANSKGKRPIPTFSKFEDGMLSAVRNLNRNPTLRAEVAAKIS